MMARPENVGQVDAREVSYSDELFDAKAPRAGERSAERAVRHADGNRGRPLAQPTSMQHAGDSPTDVAVDAPIGVGVLRSVLRGHSHGAQANG